MAGNPWLPEDSDPKPSPVLTEPVAEAPTSSTRPRAGVPEPDTADQLPARQFSYNAALWVIGAHGGAGESSVAALHPQWRDARRGTGTATRHRRHFRSPCLGQMDRPGSLPGRVDCGRRDDGRQLSTRRGRRACRPYWNGPRRRNHHRRSQCHGRLPDVHLRSMSYE